MSIESLQETSGTIFEKSLEETQVSLLFEEQPNYVLKVIRLNPGISKLNFICCMIYYMLMVFSFATPGILQPLILLDKDYYHISQDNAGTITSLVLVIQLVVKIIVSIPYGHLADKFGRKAIIIYGAVNYIISCTLVPFQSSVFPGFMLVKAIYANAVTALSTVPLLADYIADESKGKAVGLMALLLGLSAVLSNLFLKVLFYAKVSLGTCYIVTGAFIFISLILNNFGLKGGKYYHTEENISNDSNHPSLINQVKSSIEIFRENGWLMIALVLQTLGSSDFIVFFTFMALYVKSMFPETTDDATQNIAVNNLQTLVLVALLLSNMLYGYLLDKKNKIMGISLFALLGGVLSFILLSLSHTPYRWTMILGAVLLGGTVPGLYCISTYLGIRNFPANKRGVMIGMMGVVGYFGYFMLASIGGILYDYWRKDGPFIVCIIILSFASILILIINAKMNKKQTAV